MDAVEVAASYSALFTEVRRRFARRRDPRREPLSNEALAVLHHLRDAGPLTVAEAARHFDRSPSATSERLRRMIDAGLLTQLEDQEDRRRHLLWLSEAGERRLAEERQLLDPAALARAAEHMPPQQRRHLLHATRQLLDAWLPEAQDPPS